MMQPAKVEPRRRERERRAGQDDAKYRDPEEHQRRKLVTQAARRQAMAHVCTVHGASERRACEVIGVERSS